ncbi:MAG TPA: glycine cleavage system protein GcvH [Burkholderiales bacterium]|nr:glycine cleavage system protein GcvH [Burkholderiales bacterium]
MEIPADRKYSETHQWARLESDGIASIGITDHAQAQLGDLVFVEPPAVGRRLARGEQCGIVESVKSASEIYAPLSGEVVAVNGELDAAPEKINANANEAWIFRLKPADAAQFDALLDAGAYGALIAE